MRDGTRVAVVTGATGAIGRAIAEGIARAGDHEVVVVGRNPKKTARLADELASATGRPARSEVVDLSLRSEIDAFGARWRGPLHVLVNNAAIAPRRRAETAEGIEVQLATNVLGYLWLTDALRPALAASAPSRVVNVASYWAGDLDLADLELARRPYSNGTAYRQSKQANRMLTVALAEELGPEGIAVNACHPGDVQSALSNDLGFGGHESPEEGARTPVWLATQPIGQEATGRYFEHLRESRCRFGADREAVRALYEACRRY